MKTGESPQEEPDVDLPLPRYGPDDSGRLTAAINAVIQAARVLNVADGLEIRLNATVGDFDYSFLVSTVGPPKRD